MAVITQRAGAKETVRQKREREQELLVWPDLVFVEFICAILFTVTFVILSVLFNAPLLNKANPAITPDPSKAPWYFMNLQELLLHMDKGLAGVIVPTILIIGLIAVPYIDRKNEGQGAWFSTPNAVKITMFAFVWASVWITWLILWDDSAHVRVYERIPTLWGAEFENGEPPWQWPADRDHPWYEDMWFAGAWDAISDFIFLQNRLAVRDSWAWSMPVPWQASGGDGSLDWPQDFKHIPVPLNGTWIWEFEDPVDSWMPGWMRTFYWYDVYLDLPAITAEWIMPLMAMTLLPLVMVLILFRMGWATNTRDVMIALFTGFILVYTALTIIGVAFRGHGQALVPPSSVPNLEDNPAIQYYAPPADQRFVLVHRARGVPLDG